jgi:LPS sulfotransferase NodH
MRKPDLIILATQRCGSTMVCDDIALTDRLGIPSEHFTDLIFDNYSGNDNVKELCEKYDSIFNFCQTENGISSVKIMADQIQPLGKIFNLIENHPSRSFDESFVNFFKNSLFIRVSRIDRVAQSISRYAALKTGVFHKINAINNFDVISPNYIVDTDRDESGLIYDFNEINFHYKNINSEEVYLDNLIEKYNLNVINLVYENVAADRGYVYDVCSALNKSSCDFPLVSRRIQKISNSGSSHLIELFKNDLNKSVS